MKSRHDDGSLPDPASVQGEVHTETPTGTRWICLGGNLQGNIWPQASGTATAGSTHGRSTTSSISRVKHLAFSDFLSRCRRLCTDCQVSEERRCES
jgi:hypothetical protein